MNIRSDTVPRPHTEKDVPRVVIVGEDTSGRRGLETLLRASGWLPVLVSDSHEACSILADPAGPRLAIIDGVVSGHPGAALVRDIRVASTPVEPYLILVTAPEDGGGMEAGFEAGADDYLAQPILPSELQARVRVGLRAIALEEALEACVRERDAATAQVQQLQSLLPICSYCRRIRDDEHHWQHLDEYLSYHTHVRFTHGFCPQCYERHVQPSLAAS